MAQIINNQSSGDDRSKKINFWEGSIFFSFFTRNDPMMHISILIHLTMMHICMMHLSMMHVSIIHVSMMYVPTIHASMVHVSIFFFIYFSLKSKLLP